MRERRLLCISKGEYPSARVADSVHWSLHNICWDSIPKRASKGTGLRAPADLTFFEVGRSSLSLVHADGRPRLREAQHGGLLALGAHFSNREEPAIVALPPGLGKTGVMAMTPFILQASRVLVIVPSRILREQIRSELAEMELLRRLGIINVGDKRARVLETRSKFADAKAWDAARNYDFVVSTPQCVSPEITGVGEPPPDIFDLIIDRRSAPCCCPFVEASHHGFLICEDSDVHRNSVSPRHCDTTRVTSIRLSDGQSDRWRRDSSTYSETG